MTSAARPDDRDSEIALGKAPRNRTPLHAWRTVRAQAPVRASGRSILRPLGAFMKKAKRPDRRKAAKRGEPDNVRIGGRIRLARMERGFSQLRLARLIGTSYQQIGHYERGEQRTSAGRLEHIAQVLGFPVSFFFEKAALPRQVDVEEIGSLVNARDAIRLLKALHRIKSAKIRQMVMRMANELAAATFSDEGQGT